MFRATPVASFILLILLWTDRTFVPGVIAGLMVLPVVWGNLCRGIRETDPKLLELAAENLSMDPKALHIAARSENMCAVTADKVEKKLFGLMKKTSHPLRLIDEEGVIRLQKANATVRQADISSWRDAVAYMLEELTVYNDGGTNYPNVYIVLGKRIIDLSGMSSEEQIYSLANVELNGYDAKTPVIVAATLRIDS